MIGKGAAYEKGPALYCRTDLGFDSILIIQGMGGGRRIEPERRVERQQFTNWVEKYQHG